MYYAENPDAAHDIHELRVELLGQKMTFLTDAGVFSKKMVDFGSQLLLKCLEVNQGETVLDVGCGYGPLGLSLVDLKTLEQKLTAKVNHFLAKNTRICQKGHFFSQQVHSQLMNVVSSVRIFCIIHFTHETILP